MKSFSGNSHAHDFQDKQEEVQEKWNVFFIEKFVNDLFLNECDEFRVDFKEILFLALTVQAVLFSVEKDDFHQDDFTELMDQL